MYICRRKPLCGLLSAYNTVDMVAISQDTIASYYPRLTWRNEGIFVNRGVQEQSDQALITTPEGIELRSDNSHWTKPCGAYCPAVWRHSYDDDGLLKASWICPQEEVEEPESKEEMPVELLVVDVQGSRLDGEDREGGEENAENAEDDENAEDRQDGEGGGEENEKNAADAGSGWGNGSGSGWNVTAGDDWARSWDEVRNWNSDAEAQDFTYSEILRWRITNRCRNTHCLNSHLHDPRSLYVTM